MFTLRFFKVTDFSQCDQTNGQNETENSNLFSREFISLCDDGYVKSFDVTRQGSDKAFRDLGSSEKALSCESTVYDFHLHFCVHSSMFLICEIVQNPWKCEFV